MTDPALAAASRVGARFGLPADTASVLADGSNVLVRMGSVVARVATTTALVRPGVADWLARDVALARFAAGRGLPVVAPCAAPIAGPHQVDGFAVTLWPFTLHRPELVPAPDVVGSLLGELHQALREFLRRGSRRWAADLHADDLACLARTTRLDGWAALAAYPGAPAPLRSTRWSRSSHCATCKACAGR